MEDTYLKHLQARNQQYRLRREELRRQADCAFVSEDEYRALLVSRIPLDRTKDMFADVVGLRDRRDGFQFWIEAERIA